MEGKELYFVLKPSYRIVREKDIEKNLRSEGKKNNKEDYEIRNNEDVYDESTNVGTLKYTSGTYGDHKD